MPDSTAHIPGLTQSEAMQKWCFQHPDTNAKYNRCIASQCMAWRWAGNNGEWLRRKPDSDLLTPLPVGFCGLAETRTVLVKES